MDRIKQMQVFIQMMENRSFTRTAEALNLPRSTISTVIQMIEDRLQVQLFQRTTRSVVPTHDGLQYLEVARDIVDAFDASEQMFQRNPARINGYLRVDMPSRIGRRIVIPALPAFLARHPDLALELSTRDRLSDMVSEGIDCLIRVGDPADPQLVCRKLGEMELVNCVSPAYLARYGLPETATDLAKHLAVGYTHDMHPPYAAVEFEYIGKQGLQSIPMQSLINVDNAEAYIACALAGLGIIQVPRFDVQDLLESGSLLAVLPQLRPPAMQLSFLYAKRRNLPLRIKVFQEWVSRLLEAHGVLRQPPA